MSDIFPSVKSQLNYWKLRGSLASTARSSAPYANQAILNFNTGSGAGYFYDFTNANPELVPERQKTFEIGTEFKFKGNRLSADITYYKTQNRNLIAENFRASYGTGFVLNTINVGANENSGIEMVLDYQVIRKKDFTWNTRINFNRMRNKVTELPSSVPEFYISDTWLYGNARGGLTLGNPTTTITSYGYQRNTAGKILIDPATGKVLATIDATQLVQEGKGNGEVLNGIAYNSATKKLYMTGKFWPKLFEVVVKKNVVS
jgi:outer membrane receptor protein involved in Fe transport